MGKIIPKDNRHIDYDEWDYFEDLESGIGIVVNHFRDGAEPVINVYVVPKDKVANNDWHSDMEMLGDNLDRIHAERLTATLGVLAKNKNQSKRETTNESHEKITGLAPTCRMRGNV